MATIVTRSGKGSPLTHAEVDANFTNLNTDKLELSGGTMTGNLSFGDSVKATFGASADLQIYHDGSNSYISDQGTGNLRILAEDFRVVNAANSETAIQANVDGDVRLYYDAALKLATTSTGVDITGTLTSDGLDLGATTDGATVSNTASDYQLQLGAAQSTTNNIGRNISFGIAGVTTAAINTIDAGTSNSQHLAFYSGNATAVSERLRISTGGDISFYEDTGTTAKFFWDASAERLGIGNSSPATALDVTGTITSDGLTVDGSAPQIQINQANPILIFTEQDQAADSQKWGIQSESSLFKFRAFNDALSSAVTGLSISRGGDISFYEDTGTTAKFFWDASAESLGIGAGDINLSGVGTGGFNTIVTVQGNNQFRGILELANSTGVSSVGGSAGDVSWFDNDNKIAQISALGQDLTNHDDGDLAFYTASGGSVTERMRIDSSGNLLVGKTVLVRHQLRLVVGRF